MKTRIQILALALIAIVLFGGFVFAVHKYINWYDSGESESGVSWLPDFASNVSFARTNNWRIFEFDVTEAEFREWATRYELSEITEPFYIERYNYTDSIGIGGSQSDLIDPPEFAPQTVAIIDNGLKYHSWTDNRGGVSVCFDRSNGRAYFHSRKR